MGNHWFLTEYEPLRLPQTAVTPELGQQLWRDYGDKIGVEFPSPKTDQQWQLTSLGWVGHIPLPNGDELHLQPKLPLHNLFAMWQYAYQLTHIHWLAGLTAVTSLPEFYERLAELLAQQTLQRARLGLQRDYLPQTAARSTVRGQLIMREVWRKPTATAVPCRFDQHTSDISDNQILTYTLQTIARSQRCRPAIQQKVRQAYHVLHGAARPVPVSPEVCNGRFYSRLNQDYRPLHALCRFFLEQGGPAHETGEHVLRPFLINMAQLYEQFVAEWLKSHLPPTVRLQAQEKVTLGVRDEVRFEIDLVLYDGATQRPLAVLDTKYKTPDKPSNADISQIVTYAQAKQCRHAILIYPQPLPRPLDVEVGDVRLRTLTFALDTDLTAAGQQFINQLTIDD